MSACRTGEVDGYVSGWCHRTAVLQDVTLGETHEHDLGLSLHYF